MSATVMPDSRSEVKISKRTSRRLHRRLNRQLAAATAMAVAVLAAGCGGDDDRSASTAPATTIVTTPSAPATTAAPTAGSGAGVVEVVTSDFAFGGLPATVPAGAAFSVTNTSATELHEFVLIRLAEGETRSVDDLVHHDLEATLSSGPPALVVLAPPQGADAIVAVGDGTLREPGRYLAICMIPTGADPAAYLAAAAASNGAPPSVPGGPPHAMNGMYAELTVV